MHTFLTKVFKLDELNSRPGTELLAGITTFMAMAYIIFVQPSILSGKMFDMETGMPYEALVVGTCLAAAFGSILMGLLANYPIALAPGMGENFFFVLTVLPICASPALAGEAGGWKLALGLVFVSGVFFAVLSALNVRKLLLGATSPSMQYAIAGGIGLFIALIGLENGGILHTGSSGHYELYVNNLSSPATLVFLLGLGFSAGLHVLKVRGSILWGILAASLAAMILGAIPWRGVMPVGLPPSPAPVFAKMDIGGVFRHFHRLLPLIIIFTFMDVFDTLGTLIGVGTAAGLVKDGELPRSSRAFASDSLATIFGAVCGHSTVTCYIESAAGVEHGGRSGLTAICTGLCFLLALFFVPFITMIGACAAITAPALVIVGALMLRNVTFIAWDDYSEAIPSFLILAGIPFTYSIADGLTLGFISYPVIKLLGGKYRETGWLTYLIAIMLVLYLIFIKAAVAVGE